MSHIGWGDKTHKLAHHACWLVRRTRAFSPPPQGRDRSARWDGISVSSDFMFRLNSNSHVFCCVKFPSVKLCFPILGLCNCLFGTRHTFLICISHYFNSILKSDPPFQPLEIFQNWVLTEFVLSHQLCAVPECDEPAFWVLSC